MPNYAEMLAQQAGAQAAGGLIDMAFQGWRNRNQQKQNQALINQQMQAQKEMGFFNIERQLDLWNKTNAGAQLDHYKKAGLNPALMYEGGAPGGSTNATPGNVGQASADAKAGGGYTGMNIIMPAQIKLMEAQARNLDADTAKKSGVETQLGQTTIEQLKATTTNVKVQTALTRIQKDIAEISQEDVTDALSLNAEKLQQEVLQLRNQTEISDQTKQTIINTIKQQYANAILTGMMMKSGIEVNAAEINKMAHEITQKYLGLQQTQTQIGQKQVEIAQTSQQIRQKTDEIDIKTLEAIIKGTSTRVLENTGEFSMEKLKRALDQIMKK